MQRVFCVKWSPDSEFILSGSDEMNVRWVLNPSIANSLVFQRNKNTKQKTGIRKKNTHLFFLIQNLEGRSVGKIGSGKFTVKWLLYGARYASVILSRFHKWLSLLQLAPREKAALTYNKKLKERYKFHPQVLRILR